MVVALYSQTMSEMGLLGVISLLAMSACYFANAREIRRLYARHPWWEQDFVYHVGKTATVLAVVLLLVMGIGGHNLFRYNWLWFAAFQMCALRVAQQRAHAEAFACWPVESEASGEAGYVYAPA